MLSLVAQTRPAAQRLWATAGVRVCGLATDAKVPEAAADTSAAVQNWGPAVDLAVTNGLPAEYHGRVAQVYKPARTAMQQGIFSTKMWRLDFEARERWENPMMGWCSSADPLSNLQMEFPTKEDAIAFAQRQGFTVNVREPHEKKKFLRKSYGDNFSWAKRTRVGSK